MRKNILTNQQATWMTFGLTATTAVLLVTVLFGLLSPLRECALMLLAFYAAWLGYGLKMRSMRSLTILMIVTVMALPLLIGTLPDTPGSNSMVVFWQGMYLTACMANLPVAGLLLMGLMGFRHLELLQKPRIYYPLAIVAGAVCGYVSLAATLFTSSLFVPLLTTIWKG